MIVTTLGQRFDGCPVQWLSRQPDAVNLISDVQMFWMHKILPHAGGLQDQHPMFCEALEILTADRVVVEEQIRIRDGAKAQKEAEHGANKQADRKRRR